jgi:class 3 adenylate cyclase
MRTSMFVPLMTQAGGIGALILFRTEVSPYSADEVELVETFAAQAVIALENVQQFKALEARTDEVNALNASLEEKVADQVREIERIGQLKQFLPPAVADVFVSAADDKRLTSHRALIATLFCDIRGFTAFCETAEPEETIEMLQAYHEEMGRLISEYGGGVDKRMGDGIMVIFNDPIPCDDPAGDAVRLALAMRVKMRDLCARWKRLGHRLGFGVGISFGYATVGMVGSAGRFDYTASGTSVNMAARLCDMAADDEILLSPRAATAVEGDFGTNSRGEVTMKGIREPVEVFAVAAE